MTSRQTQALVAQGWGDEEGQEILNPGYDPDLYSEYGPAVRRNLGRVNEDRIDMDLIEALVTYIDETEAEGAILIFLPGVCVCVRCLICSRLRLVTSHLSPLVFLWCFFYLFVISWFEASVRSNSCIKDWRAWDGSDTTPPGC